MPINNRAVRRPAKKTMLKFFQLMVLIIFSAVIVFAQKRVHTAALQRQQIMLATTALKTAATKSSHVSNKKLAASANALLCTTPVVSGPGGLPLGFSNILSADQPGNWTTSDASKVSLTTPNATDILMKGEAVGSAMITFTSTCDGSQVTRTITVSAPTVNPGGVPGAIVWLKASAGTSTTTNGATVSTWLDQSPSGYSFAGVSDQVGVTGKRRNTSNTSTNKPTYLASAINFNPVVSYDGPDALHRFGTLASPVNGPLLSNTTSFVAGAPQANTPNRNDFANFYTNASWGAVNKTTDRLFLSATLDGIYNINGTVSLFYYGNTGSGFDDKYTNSAATATAFNASYTAYIVPFAGATYAAPFILAQANPSIASGQAANYTVSKSGTAFETLSYANHDGNLDADAPNNQINYYSLGNVPSSVFSSSGPENNSYGRMPETIIFGSGSLTTTQARQVNSYLALKYGITLDQTQAAQNYLNSNGSIVWDATAAASFKNNIFGIGRDDAGALNQLISQSGTANILTLSTNTDFATANPGTHTPVVADKSYLITADDNGALTLGAAGTSAPAGVQKLGRNWRLQNTGGVTAFLQVDGSKLPSPAAGFEYKLLYNTGSSTNFSAVTPIVASNTNGSLYTFALPTGAGTGTFSLGVGLSCKGILNGPTGLPLGFSNVLFSSKTGTWTSSNPSIVSVDAASGDSTTITSTIAGGTGTATITFTSDCDGVSTTTRVITVSAPAVNPGGVPGALVWLKASAGTNTTTNNAAVTTWLDQSPSGYSFAGVSDQVGTTGKRAGGVFATSGNLPTYTGSAVNFNPAVNYASGDALHRFGTLASPVTGPLLSNTTSFTAGSSPYPGDDPNSFFEINTNWASLYLNGATSRTLVSASPTSVAVGVLGITSLSNLHHNDGTEQIFMRNFSAPQLSQYALSKTPYIVTQANPAVTPGPASNYAMSISGSALKTIIGSGGPYDIMVAASANNLHHYYSLGNTPSSVVTFATNTLAGDGFGQMTETIIFGNGALTAQQTQQVNSYLAIKYGVTLDQTTAQNYLNSNGSVVWDATAAGAFKNNIFGIGRDDAGALNQLVSKSGNAAISVVNDILTLSTNTDFSSANPGTHTAIGADKNYLITADDNGAINSWGASGVSAPAGIQKLTRNWLLQNTGGLAAYVQVDVSKLSGQPGGSTYALLYKTGTSTDFSAVAPILPTSNSGSLYTFQLPATAGTASFSIGASVCTIPTINGPVGLPVNFSNVLFASQSGTWTTSDAGKVSLTGTSGDSTTINGVSTGVATITFTTACGAATSRDITVTAPTINPGGVPGALVWLKASAGTNTTTNGAAVTTWLDQSPSQYSFAGVSDQVGTTGLRKNGSATSGNKPTYVSSSVNFNPAVNYAGVDALHRFGTLASPVTGPLLSNTTSFTAGSSPNPNGYATSFYAQNFHWASQYQNGASRSALLTAAAGPDYNGLLLIYFPGINNSSYTSEGMTFPLNVPQFNNTSLYTTPYIVAQANPSIATGQPGNYTVSYSGSVFNNPAFSSASTAVTEAANNLAYYYSLGNIPSSIMKFAADDDSYGQMTETIIFGSGALTSNEKQRVNSYLAFKYGITMDNSTGSDNYLLSDGTTAWDASVQPAYHNDVISIIRDDASGLAQKQSHTFDDKLRVFVGSLAATNAGNSGSISNDKSSIMIGNNGGALISSTTGPKPATVQKISGRTWKITKTNFTDPFSIEFAVDPAEVVDITKARLIVSTSATPDFSTATAYDNTSGLTFTQGSVIVGNITTQIPAGTSFVTFGFAPLTILPVSLTAFNANVVDNNKVALSWQTASEVNSDYFIVERSANNNSWETAAQVKAAGNSSAAKDYSTVDKNPYSGVSYYRLKQTNADGNYKYSDVRTIKIDKARNSAVVVYPNPVAKQLTIKGDATELKTVKLYNAAGQDVTGAVKTIQQNSDGIVLDLSTLPGGTYSVKTINTLTKVIKL